MKFLIIPILLIIAAYAVLMNHQITKNKKIEEYYVNTRVVINGDTALVVKYSLLFDECTLSNGVEVSPTFVDNNKIK